MYSCPYNVGDVVPKYIRYASITLCERLKHFDKALGESNLNLPAYRFVVNANVKRKKF